MRPFKVKVLAGILLLRNAKMAEFMNANIPGMSVPQAMIKELRAAGDKSEDVGRGNRGAQHQGRASPLRRGTYHGDQGDASAGGNHHQGRNSHDDRP